MASNDNDNSLIAGALFLVAGGIVGAGVALLFAPQSGTKTRKDICRFARKARRSAEDAVEVVEDFKDNLSDIVEEVGERATEILETGKDMAYGAKKKLLKALEESGEQLEKQRAKLSKLVG
ncbi:YtxH domain-containing protein [Geomesophilobacter sediminis]|uniref:YtxH domain-containing protein n=1 Tax=Geomesophilobacter sediminis TaxID=2798584 RepID=A0A8J7LTC9_9BACT|nr:YtxH domain-containing protein [Geomesophilobacter sediminis]MBJ6723254.1 YtxH domain-containing protein [Geomesophilobacter sediminis]